MRFLLLQARKPTDAARTAEYNAFCDVLDVPAEHVRSWDLTGGAPGPAELEAVDCVLVGGAGEYSLTAVAQHAWMGQFVDFVGKLVEDGFPTFGSCFGFQAMVLAGGGEVVKDRSRAEIGTFSANLTDEGEADPLFAPLGSPFYAQFGHQDHATRIPAGTVNLAWSERSPYQALTVPGKPIYATQFHPELSMEENRARFYNYIDEYSKPDVVDSPEKVLAAFRPTTEATAVLRRFVDRLRNG